MKFFSNIIKKENRKKLHFIVRWVKREKKEKREKKRERRKEDCHLNRPSGMEIYIYGNILEAAKAKEEEEDEEEDWEKCVFRLFLQATN